MKIHASVNQRERDKSDDDGSLTWGRVISVNRAMAAVCAADDQDEERARG